MRLYLVLAGLEGIEPPTRVLETHVMPLHHRPLVDIYRLLCFTMHCFGSTHITKLVDLKFYRRR